MRTEKYYQKLLSDLSNRDDVLIEKYPLKYKNGSFIFLKIKSKEIKPDDDILLIASGIHGNEIAGPATLEKHLNEIFDYANKNKVKLILYPLINPSGFEINARYNIDGEKINNDFIRYETANGKIVEEIKNQELYKKWHWSSDAKLKLKLPQETALMHRLLKKDPLHQIEGIIDLHQDYISNFKKPAAYHYSFGNLSVHKNIIDKIRLIAPILKKTKIGAGQNGAMKTNKNGFIVRHDGTLGDLFASLGAKYSVTAETTGATPIEAVCKINLLWIYGLIDLIKQPDKKEIFFTTSFLPKKITPESNVHLIHTSSPVEKNDLKLFETVTKKLAKQFAFVKIFNVKKTELDPRYLAASEKERLRKFRQARKKVNWLLPIYGGTGCPDIIRHLDDNDFAKIRKYRPIINGFSDTTSLINYVYFKIKLITFHYANACGLYSAGNHKLWFNIITGNINAFSFWENKYAWLSPKPKRKIEGIAIGGNMTSFLEMLNVTNLKVKSWQPYIFFIEDIEIDVEDLHNLIVSLDEKGVFKNVRAIVIGRINEKRFADNTKKLNLLFGGKKIPADKTINYLLGPVISQRKKVNDPLYILKINNFGHDIKSNAIIIPIGGKTVINPDGKINFIGPFVKQFSRFGDTTAINQPRENIQISLK